MSLYYVKCKFGLQTATETIFQPWASYFTFTKRLALRQNTMRWWNSRSLTNGFNYPLTFNEIK